VDHYVQIEDVDDKMAVYVRAIRNIVSFLRQDVFDYVIILRNLCLMLILILSLFPLRRNVGSKKSKKLRKVSANRPSRKKKKNNNNKRMTSQVTASPHQAVGIVDLGQEKAVMKMKIKHLTQKTVTLKKKHNFKNCRYVN